MSFRKSSFWLTSKIGLEKSLPTSRHSKMVKIPSQATGWPRSGRRDTNRSEAIRFCHFSTNILRAVGSCDSLEARRI